MSDEDKNIIENSFAKQALQYSKKFLPEFLEEGEKFTDRLQKVVKDSLKRPGLNINEITVGKVLKVIKNGKPIPGGFRDDLNKQNNFENESCLQIYVHTMFDSLYSIPSNLINPGSEEPLIYQHYIYEAQDLALDKEVPNVGDSVYVFHPLSKGYLNRVGIYMGIVGKTAVPIANDPPSKNFKEKVQRKQAVPINLPQKSQCETNPKGDNCAWQAGRVIGEIDLAPLPSPKSGFKAKPEVVNAFFNMKAAFEADNPGKTLQVNSGFRTYKQQEEARAYWTKQGEPSKAARPGFSRHQNGIAVDINTDGSKPPGYLTSVYLWLRENAPQYGFVRTVRSEPWHWVYFGPEKAAKRIPSWQ